MAKGVRMREWMSMAGEEGMLRCCRVVVRGWSRWRLEIGERERERERKR
jgi:hypothetical protein